MPSYRCPHPAHSGPAVLLKSNNDQVFECEHSHRFFKRVEGGALHLVDLISGQTFPLLAHDGAAPAGEPPGLQLNFMTDVPRVADDLDFNDLSLTAAEWRLLSKVDGRSTIEEVRLLSGLRAEDAERMVRRFVASGLLEIRSKR